jgi:nitrite reductase (NO-forming)
MSVATETVHMRTLEQIEHQIEEDLEHQNEIEERTERLEMRQGLLAVITAAAVAVVMTAAVALVFISSETKGMSEVIATAPTAKTQLPAAASHDGGHAQPAGEFDGKFEAYDRPDPTLPAAPAGAVKRFEVDVYEHVTKVHKSKPPTEVWSYAINGKEHRGTGVSEPMVVTQGDKVEITLVNGGSKKMNVTFPHSIDYHSAELAPNEAFKSIEPGETHKFSFVAKHPGVFMYHCATPPVLLHTGAGMVGMMVVKPKDLAPVDKELWVTQQEYYIGLPGKLADQKKMEAKTPDVIAFNGFADQYAEHPITVKRGESVRMYVLNAGPSIWSAFHVIGTVFDRTVVEGVVGKHAQTINLAPSQGGWVEFTLEAEGAYPFVTHAFGDMVAGAVGVLATENHKGPSGH